MSKNKMFVMSSFSPLSYGSYGTTHRSGRRTRGAGGEVSIYSEIGIHAHYRYFSPDRKYKNTDHENRTPHQQLTIKDRSLLQIRAYAVLSGSRRNILQIKIL